MIFVRIMLCSSHKLHLNSSSFAFVGMLKSSGEAITRSAVRCATAAEKGSEPELYVTNLPRPPPAKICRSVFLGDGQSFPIAASTSALVPFTFREQSVRCWVRLF